MIRYTVLSVFVAILFTLGCSKEEVKVDSGNGGNPNINRRLKVVTLHRYNRNNALDSALPNVTVTLYYDPVNRTDKTNPVIDQKTGLDGTTEFNYLKDTTYYLWLEHPDLTSKLVRTVPITTTYAEEGFIF